MNAPNYAGLGNSHVSVLRQLEPNVFEVAVLYPFGAENAAVQAAVTKVMQLLAQPNLGEASANTPDFDDTSDRVATTAFVNLVKIALLSHIDNTVLSQVKLLVADAVADVLQTPGVMAGLLPDALPTSGETPWLNKGVLTVTPKD